MELHHPLRVVTPSIDGDALAVLARAEADFTPSQVRDLIGEYSVEGVRNSLNRLAGQGIVSARPAGNSVLYRLNRAHLAAAAIEELASLRETFIERIRATVGQWESPCSFAALFGSAANNTMTADSDIDIFCVRPAGVDADDVDWRDQLDLLGSDITAWTGNEARIVEYGAEEVEVGLDVDERLLVDIDVDGIWLAGRRDYLRDRRGT